MVNWRWRQLYENFTYDFLMERMLKSIPDTIDKRQGSVVHDMLSPSALELAEGYQYNDMILDEGFADSASYYYLLKRAAERGISPYQATYATWKGVFTPSTVEIAIGERFNYDDINFVVTEKIQAGEYKLQCETEGEVGNSVVGSLIPINSVEGLETAKLTELLVPGEEMESQEDFRLRYFASINSQAFGGNVADYQNFLDSIGGVGPTKIIPTWNGGGTVKIVILDSTYGVPSKELVEEVQTAVDPEQNQGAGIGMAPIGHVVTVVGAKETKINVTTTITYKSGYSFDQLKTELESALETYLLGLRSALKEDWTEETQIIVRVSQVEARFLMVEGVQDIANTQINGSQSNLILEKDFVPTRGEISG